MPRISGSTVHLHSESLITRCRNMIVLKFLSEESFTHLFWIDSDIAFQSEAVFRLLQADRDVVAGVYSNEAIQLASRGSARRETAYRLSVQPDRARRDPRQPIRDGFVEVAEAPTGPPNNPQAHLYWRFFDC